MNAMRALIEQLERHIRLVNHHGIKCTWENTCADELCRRLKEAFDEHLDATTSKGQRLPKKKIDEMDEMYPNRRGRACAFCEFWEEDVSESGGWCLRYPPVRTEEGRPANVLTQPDDWCGEFQPGANHP